MAASAHFFAWAGLDYPAALNGPAGELEDRTGGSVSNGMFQKLANSALNAEIAALEWATREGAYPLRIFRLAAEDEIDGLAQHSAVDLGHGFVTQLHRAGYTAADRWLQQTPNDTPVALEQPRKAPTAFWVAPSFADAAV